MYLKINSLEEFEQNILESEAVLAYFSNEICNVCKVLKPQILELINSDFPKIKLIYIDIEKTPEISAQNSIFTIPTLIVYFQNKEFIRISRHISIGELQKSIERPYNLIF